MVLSCDMRDCQKAGAAVCVVKEVTFVYTVIVYLNSSPGAVYMRQ